MPINDISTKEYHPILDVSGRLLLNVKINLSTDKEISFLQNLTFKDIGQELTNDAAKKCFWINIYNSHFQMMAIDATISRNKIYKTKKVNIGGHHFSLDDIEHGILRRYRWKWSLGYLPDLFTSRLIKDLVVDLVDSRIHFALNCGAASCPPIAFYSFLTLEQQLETAMTSFVESETSIDHDKKIIRTNRIFQWYVGDFGGKKGILKLLSDVFQKDLSNYNIIYNPYNWNAKLGNYS